MINNLKQMTPEQKRKRRTIIYLYVLFALLILLVAATYTWFSLSHTPRVSDMAIYVNATKGVELATAYDADDEDWGQMLNFSDLVSQETPLKPVTWVESEQVFKTLIYGLDGRGAGKWEILSDQEHANRDDDKGYYVVGTFYVRSDMDCAVSLAEAVEMNQGEDGAGTFVVGTPVWNDQSIQHDNGGQGAECAVRLGFKITYIDDITGEEITEPEFYIYEPNCDIHIDGSSGYVETPSIDGEEELGSYMILQSASTWMEAYPVERDVTIKTLGEFMTDTELFTMESQDMVKIDLYVWLEGQDVDCTNTIQEARIFSSIQFHTDYSQQSGLVDIP